MIQNKTKIIGITGNSGSGKTTVTNILKESNSYTIIGDEISREVFEINTPCYFDVIKNFGTEILNEDKNINRKKLGAIVFNDENKLKLLTKITHKYIIEIIIERSEKAKEKNIYDYIVIDAPILINTKLENYVDEIWIVYADYNTLIKRITRRDNISREDAILRLSNQMNFKELKKYGDVFINTSKGSINFLKNNIKEILEKKQGENNV